MSILKLTSDTLVGTPATGNIEYNGQFFGTDSNNSRAQMQRLVLATSQTASGTSVDFTGIPAWVKKITVMFNGISTNGTSTIQVQLGDSGGIETTGYNSTGSTAAGTVATITSGFAIIPPAASNVISGHCTITLFDTANSWVYSSLIKAVATMYYAAGDKATSATLDRIRITTVNGTDTFDAGSINILYEG